MSETRLEIELLSMMIVALGSLIVNETLETTTYNFAQVPPLSDSIGECFTLIQFFIYFWTFLDRENQYTLF